MRPRSAAPIRLQIEPRTLRLAAPRQGTQLQISIPGGSEPRDVTSSVRYFVSPPGVVEVSPTGWVSGLKDGDAAVRVRYVAGRSVAEATIPVTVRGVSANVPVSFANDVVPALTLAGCNQGACHGAAPGRGGLKLSLLGDDPERDFQALLREAGGRRVNRAEPGASLLLRKPAMQLPHAGGLRLRTGSSGYRLLAQWLAEGAPGPTWGERRVASLLVTPPSRLLRPGEQQQVRVLARYSDGSTADVTTSARYNTNDDSVAGVDGPGLVRAAGPGATAIMIRYQGEVAVARVSVPFTQVARAAPRAGDGFVDRWVSREWDRLGLLPSRTCTDGEFIRRASLDATGTLPSPERVASFAADPDPLKRAKLVDELLERPEWVDYWSLYLGDLLRNNRTLVGEKGMWAFRAWLREGLRSDRSLNEMIRQMIDVRGSTYRNPASNYYSVVRTPEELAETTSQVFLGVRLQCAKCHDHPFERWKQADYYGFAAYFARVKYKGFSDIGSFGGDQLVLTADTGEVQHPKSLQPMQPKPLLGDAPTVEGGRRLSALAGWLAAPENPFVARNFVNRIWARLMGRGFIEPVDDVRSSNPPTHPELLDALSSDFVAHKFSLKHLMRRILTARAYQLSSAPTRQNVRDERFYSRYYVRRLPAEPLLDAICSVTGVPESFVGLPAGTRAISLPDSTVGSYFLETFGRAPRLVACECERDAGANLAQVLHLANSDFIQNKLTHQNGRLASLLAAGKSDAEIADAFYTLAFGRPPSADERATAIKCVAQAASRKEGLEDLVWTLLNSREFLLNH